MESNFRERQGSGKRKDGEEMMVETAAKDLEKSSRGLWMGIACQTNRESGEEQKEGKVRSGRKDRRGESCVGKELQKEL